VLSKPWDKFYYDADSLADTFSGMLAY